MELKSGFVTPQEEMEVSEFVSMLWPLKEKDKVAIPLTVPWINNCFSICKAMMLILHHLSKAIILGMERMLHK